MLTQQWVLDSSAIVEPQIKAEIEQLWTNEDLSDDSYFPWDANDSCWVLLISGSYESTYAKVYPKLHAFLNQSRIQKCLIRVS